MSATPRAIRTAALALTATGAAVLAYSLLEAQSYRLRAVRVPVLPAGQPPLLILHLSDLHLTPGQHAKQQWIRELAQLGPDLVISTGDFIAHPEAVGPVLDCLEPFRDVPGAFVLGSNDYYAPGLKNPLRYLLPDDGRRTFGPDLPWPELVAGLTGFGWLDLDNAEGRLTAAGREIDLRGVDDPHIGRDRYRGVAGPFDPTADLALGVTHAPYLAVLDAMTADGAQLILAGHTHGGQVCVPGYGALVTNCDLPAAMAKGLHPYCNAWLHVSAGLGTSPYAPVRLACPPEATLLTLVPAGT